MKIYKML